MLDRGDEPIDRSVTLLERVGPEQHEWAVFGVGDHDRRQSAGGGADRIGLIVAVEGDELDRQAFPARAPLGALTYGSVSDLAQRAVPPSEPGTHPVRELAAPRAVGVVHPDESNDSHCHRPTVHPSGQNREMPEMDVVIRPEAPGDESAIDAVVREAFLQQFGSDSEVGLVRTMRDRRELVPELTLVAEVDGRVVGFIAFSEVAVDGERARGLGLAPVAVAPEFQGDGIGGALIRAGLSRATEAGWRFVVLLGHEHYYPRFGFVPAAPLGLRGDYGDGASWMVRPLADATLTQGHVQYSSAFRE